MLVLILSSEGLDQDVPPLVHWVSSLPEPNVNVLAAPVTPVPKTLVLESPDAAGLAPVPTQVFPVPSVVT